jgi:hypothetical protein
MASETKEIGDFVYEVTKPLARPGLQFAIRISRYVFPFYGHLLISKGEGTSLLTAVGDLLGRLTPEEVEHINTTLGALTQVYFVTEDGEQKSRTLDGKFFDVHFQDRYDAWLQWVVFALQTTCRSFFVGALKLGAKAQSKPEAPTPNPATSSPSPSSVERSG